MSDEDALLAAIAANPDEDTPRLAYADWCDEHDQPARAEFIRLQCGWRDTAELPTGARRKLQERVRFLIQNRLRELIGPLGGELTPLDVRFDRGFLIEVNITARQFVQDPHAFAELRPLPRINVRNLSRDTLDRFIARPEVDCITSIAVNYPGSGAAALAACPLSRLESARLDPPRRGCGMATPSWRRSPSRTKLPRLVSLEVPGNEIGDAGVARLVESPLWRQVWRLNLSHNPITAAGADRLAEAPESRIGSLVLEGLDLDAAARGRLTRRFGYGVRL
jgi:uncharacterized protein (TIGR02996 family)